MNFQHIKTFCAVIDEKSMTAAAKKLHLTQPAVSQHIQQLESDIGDSLFLRGSREAKLTPQGIIFYRYAQQILQLSARAKIAIESTHSEVMGTVRVGTLSSVGLHYIGPVFSIFLKNNQNVQLKLQYGTGKRILELLESGQLDIAVVPDSSLEYGGDPESLKKEILAEDEMVLVTSSSDESSPHEISLSELPSKPLVKIEDEYSGFDQKLSRELQKGKVNVKTVFESSNVGTIKKIIESGIGWGFLPAHSIQKQLQAGRLRKINVKDFEYPFQIAAYTQKSNPIKAISVFLNGLRELTSTQHN